MTITKSAPVAKRRKKIAKVKSKEPRASKKIDQKLFAPVNEVRLVGRVTSLAIAKVLPSGDKVVEFRVVIGREKIRNGKKEVDSLDIAAWSASARRSALAVKIDTWVEVRGSVRRRFWRAPNGLASRWQVEASDVVRL
jgi:single-strand DNA-binding protein